MKTLQLGENADEAEVQGLYKHTKINYQGEVAC